MRNRGRRATERYEVRRINCDIRLHKISANRIRISFNCLNQSILFADQNNINAILIFKCQKRYWDLFLICIYDYWIFREFEKNIQIDLNNFIKHRSVKIDKKKSSFKQKWTKILQNVIWTWFFVSFLDHAKRPFVWQGGNSHCLHSNLF